MVRKWSGMVGYNESYQVLSHYLGQDKLFRADCQSSVVGEAP